MDGARRNIHSSPPQENQTAVENLNTENFQGFIFELFEKNGILNNLRAHLRGHIVNVLKSARAGETPKCHKQFTRRLDLRNQALNMLIAEYLVRLDFSYTLSVFVSEIPLANMVFGFADTLLRWNPDDDLAELYFSEDDVCSLLNHLGLQMASDQALKILQMYKKADNPLLLCILTCMSLLKEPHIESDYSSDTISSPSCPDVPSQLNKPTHRSHSMGHHVKCKHFTFCKSCQSRIIKIKDKFKEQKLCMTEDRNQTSMNVSYKMLMKDLSGMERTVVDEMFQQLQSVYEQEMELMRIEEEKKVTNSVKSCSVQLEKRKDELEAVFKAREGDLERSTQVKKKFLWGLARSLRDQHAHLLRAMRAVRDESKRLADKEQKLKMQLKEAEEILKKRGEDMKMQISNEIETLATHLKALKIEKDSIRKEKQELETLKSALENDSKVNDKVGSNNDSKVNDKCERNDVDASRFELLQSELAALKKYLETSKPQKPPVLVSEISTVTDFKSVCLNNEQDFERNSVVDGTSSHKVNPNQVVNDFKKQKNTNHSTAAELHRARSRSRSPTGIEPGTRATEADIQLMREENERLRHFSRQQQQHIEKLTSLQTRLQAELTTAQCRIDNLTINRPQLQPEPFYVTMQRASASTPPLRLAGRGEEVMAYSALTPRVVVPGDRVPFLGVVDAKRSEGRRHLLNQWRALRKSTPAKPPRGGSTNKPPGSGCVTNSDVTPGASNIEHEPANSEIPQGKKENSSSRGLQIKKEKRPSTNKNRKADTEQSKSKPKKTDNDNTSSKYLDQSSDIAIKEARRQLRKLEIEAEAVEMSYLRFKSRQESGGKPVGEALSSSRHTTEIATKRKSCNLETRARELQSTKLDYYNIMNGYQQNYDDYFKNRNAAANLVGPIPHGFAETEGKTDKSNVDYLEKPLAEFRKLYNARNRKRFPDRVEKFREFAMENHCDEANEITKQENKELERSQIKEVMSTIEEKSETQVTPTENKENTEVERKNNVNKPSSTKSHGKSELEKLEENINNFLNSRSFSAKELKPEQKPNKTNDLKTPQFSQLTAEHINKLLEISQMKASPLDYNVDVGTNIESKPDSNVIEKYDEETVTQNLIVLVESTEDTKQICKTEIDGTRVTTEMTVTVTPKLNELDEETRELLEKQPDSLEVQANLNRNEVIEAVFSEKDELNTNSDTKINNNSKEDILSDAFDEYEDDFNAEMDNSDKLTNDNISVNKTDEETDNFWE